MKALNQFNNIARRDGLYNLLNLSKLKPVVIEGNQWKHWRYSYDCYIVENMRNLKGKRNFDDLEAVKRRETHEIYLKNKNV